MFSLDEQSAKLNAAGCRLRQLVADERLAHLEPVESHVAAMDRLARHHNESVTGEHRLGHQARVRRPLLQASRDLRNGTTGQKRYRQDRR